MFNEIMLLLVFLHCPIFSDFGPDDPETQYAFGFPFISFILATILINLGTIFYDMLRRIMLVGKKRYNLIERWYN